MSLRFYHRLIRSLILPSNAGPNDPATVIGPDIPEELRVYYEGENRTVVQATILRQDDGTYIYIANITSDPVPGVPLSPQMGIGTCEKTLNGTKVVREACRVDSPLVPALPAMTFGATSLGSELVVRGEFSSLQIVDEAKLIYQGEELDPVTRVYIPSNNLVLTDTNMQAVPNFTLSVAPGWTYYSRVRISYTGPTSDDIKFDWARTGGVQNTDIRRFIVGLATGTTTNQSSSIAMPRRDGDTDQQIGADGGAGSGATSYWEDAIITPTGAGTVTFRAGKVADTAGTNTTVFDESRMIVTRCSTVT